MLRYIALQVLVVCAVALVAAAIGGQHAALSALLGGLACTVPNALFALRLALVAQRAAAAGEIHDGSRHVAAFFFGEFVKIISTVGLLALIVWAYKDLVWLALIIAFIAALKSYLIALMLFRRT